MKQKTTIPPYLAKTRGGNKIIDPKGLYNAFVESGMTIRPFCKSIGMSVNTVKKNLPADILAEMKALSSARATALRSARVTDRNKNTPLRKELADPKGFYNTFVESGMCLEPYCKFIGIGINTVKRHLPEDVLLACKEHSHKVDLAFKHSVTFKNKHSAITTNLFKDPVHKDHHKASVTTDEYKSNMSSIVNTRYKEHPELRDLLSALNSQRYKDHPELKEQQSVAMSMYWENHPEVRIAMINKDKQHFVNHPEECDARSARAYRWHETGTGMFSPEGRHNRHVALGKAGQQGSKQQNDLAEELKAYGLNVINGTALNWELLSDEDKELDIYLPDYNLAIEVNGEYHHSTAKIESKYYHLNKMLCAQQNGIRLLQFWVYSELEPKHNQVLNKILSLTGTLKRQRVYARKTIVRKVDATEVKEFLNTYHIQGYTDSTYYALYSKDGILLACMGFKKHASNTADGKFNAYNLTRYCTHPDYFVIGGYEKLEKAMVRDLNPDYITSIADLRTSTGALYEHQGFYKVGTIKPDYMYYYKRTLVHKFNFRLKRFKEDPNLQYEEGLSEKQLAELNDIPRCYDCGKIKYRKDFRQLGDTLSSTPHIE